MEQQPNKFIAVAYELFTIDEDGTAHKEQQVTAEEPFSFISGFGITHKEFENNIYPLQTGDTFDFTLTPQQGFGEYIDEAVAEIPRETFFVDGKFDDQHCFVGAIIPLQNQEGQHFNGIVMDIDNEKVTVDLNHPWAGKGLNFKGTIVESREATNDEVMNLIKQLTSGCGGCGGCGGGGCDEDHECGKGEGHKCGKDEDHDAQGCGKHQCPHHQ